MVAESFTRGAHAFVACTSRALRSNSCSQALERTQRSGRPAGVMPCVVSSQQLRQRTLANSNSYSVPVIVDVIAIVVVNRTDTFAETRPCDGMSLPAPPVPDDRHSHASDAEWHIGTLPCRHSHTLCQRERAFDFERRRRQLSVVACSRVHADKSSRCGGG